MANHSLRDRKLLLATRVKALSEVRNLMQWTMEALPEVSAMSYTAGRKDSLRDFLKVLEMRLTKAERQLRRTKARLSQ